MSQSSYDLSLTKTELAIILPLLKLGMDTYRGGITGPLADVIDCVPKEAFLTLALKLHTLGQQAKQ